MWDIGGIPIVERNHGLVVSQFLFTTLAVLAVCLRLFTRGALVRNLGLDDYFASFAMLGTIGFLIAMLFQIKYGLGDKVNLETLQNFLQSLLATVMAYGICHTSIKLSILLQYKRIFTSAVAQRLFFGLITWMILYGLFCNLSSLITCWPIAKYWNDAIPGGCLDRSLLHYVLAGFNILNDIMLLASPLPFLKSLQIARRAKLVLIAVFACGGFACIVAIIRLHSLWVNNSAPIQEQPIKGVDIALWSGLEINVAIICASVPAIKPLFSKFFPRILSSLGQSAKQSNNGHGTQDSTPLRSYDKRTDSVADHELEIGMEVEVQQSYERKGLPADGDGGSERNLVMGAAGRSWATECYAGDRDSSVGSKYPVTA